ncbi:MAG: PorV/PorQ family protein [Elusimicrobia bacterium]|nr:PorV/PorQ family protein [Elusimicrobiota bacterium]
MRKVKACLFLLSMAPAFPWFSHATINTGADFLNIAVGARPVGMGNAYTAMASDVASLHWNPAGISRMQGRELAATHAQWLLDTRYDFVGFGLPTQRGNWGLGLARLSQPRFDGRSDSGQKNGDFSAYDQALTLAFGKPIGNSHLGFGLKFIQSQIASYQAHSFAVDLGLIRQIPVSFLQVPVSLGLSAQNIGPGMKFAEQRDPLPLTFAAGLAYPFFQAVSLAMDIKQKPRERTTDVSFGTEYQILPNLALRGGYLSQLGISSRQAFGGVAAGIGISILGSRMDYAITPFGDLGNVHRISLSYRW